MTCHLLLLAMLCFTVIVAALWNRAGHYIFVVWFLSSFFFPGLMSAVRDAMCMVWP